MLCNESRKPFLEPVKMGYFCLQEHPSLTKAERKKICGLMDVKKLTMEASMHAAQNDRLPLRVVVQVLFFVQVKTATRAQSRNSDARTTCISKMSPDEEWDKTMGEDCRPLKKEMSEVEINEDGGQKNTKIGKKKSENSKSGMQLLPSRSRRIFDKLWVVRAGKGHVENRSSEMSGSSQSPSSVRDNTIKSSGIPSRHGRHSVS